MSAGAWDCGSAPARRPGRIRSWKPFIVGSLWGTLSGSHSASLTSAGETFTFTDEPEDLWGVVSAGVNFFNFVSNTAAFAKVDVTFGVGGKAGMRVAW